MTLPRPNVPAFAGLPALALVALILVPAAPQEAVGQSALGAGGLGLLSEGRDARARGLGVPGIGMRGWYLSLEDPAAQAGIGLPSIMAGFQPATGEGDGDMSSGGTRFPAAGVAYPLGRHVLSVQFGSFLDQEWEARVERTVSLSGEAVDAVDRYESVGGIGQVRVGWATRLGEAVAVGLSGGTQVGSLERRFSRTLDEAAVGPEMEPFRTSGRWRASGAVVSAGAIWDPSSLLRLSVSAEWDDDMTLEPLAATEGGSRESPMATTVRAGGTFALTPRVAFVAGVSRADWSGMDEALGGNAARDLAWGYGGGVEWVAGSVLGRDIPVRLGARRQDLPFHFDGEPAREGSVSGGFGLHLVDSGELPVARIEVSLERGSRDAGAFSEDYWRTTVSLRLAGS